MDCNKMHCNRIRLSLAAAVDQFLVILLITDVCELFRLQYEARDKLFIG